MPRTLIGVRFDVTKAISNNYGYEFWKVIWGAVDPTMWSEISFYEGDSNDSIRGLEQVYIIAFRPSWEHSGVAELRASLEGDATFQKVAAQPPFVQGEECSREPLVSAGNIGPAGNFSEDALRPRRTLAEVKGIDADELMHPRWKLKPQFRVSPTKEQSMGSKKKPWWKPW
jgi:hypothetical protein